MELYVIMTAAILSLFTHWWASPYILYGHLCSNGKSKWNPCLLNVYICIRVWVFLISRIQINYQQVFQANYSDCLPKWINNISISDIWPFTTTLYWNSVFAYCPKLVPPFLGLVVSKRQSAPLARAVGLPYLWPRCDLCLWLGWFVSPAHAKSELHSPQSQWVVLKKGNVPTRIATKKMVNKHKSSSAREGNVQVHALFACVFHHAVSRTLGVCDGSSWDRSLGTLRNSRRAHWWWTVVAFANRDENKISHFGSRYHNKRKLYSLSIENRHSESSNVGMLIGFKFHWK